MHPTPKETATYRFQTTLRPLSSSVRTDRNASEVDQGVLCRVGVAMLAALAGLRFVQIVGTLQAMLSPSYLVFLTACVAVAVAAVAASHPRTGIAARVLFMAAIGASKFTRVVGTPPDNEDVGNWSFTPGLAALFVETTTVAFSAYSPGKKGARRHRAVATACSSDSDSSRLETARPTSAQQPGQHAP